MDEAYDVEEQECTEDQREEPLTGRSVYCSAKVQSPEGGQFAGRFLYEDMLFFNGGRTLAAGSGTVWVNVDVGDLLPGGAWACDLSMGSETVSARFRSTGPVPQVVGVSACLTVNTMSAGSTRVCAEDESDKPLGPTNSVTCSATVFGGTGDVMRVDFVRLGNEGAVSVQREIPQSLVDFGAHLTQSPSLLPGDYACTFFLGDEQVGETTFSIRS